MQHILTSGNELVHVMTSPTSAASRCTRSHGRTRSLRVRILPDAPNKTGAQPIPGEAFLRSGRGRYATVFLHAAQQQASEASVPWMVVRAYAGSHRASAARGSSYTSRVMKAHWNRSDYESMNQWGFHFSLDQVRQLALITTTKLPESGHVCALTGFAAVSANDRNVHMNSFSTSSAASGVRGSAWIQDCRPIGSRRRRNFNPHSTIELSHLHRGAGATDP